MTFGSLNFVESWNMILCFITLTSDWREKIQSSYSPIWAIFFHANLKCKYVIGLFPCNWRFLSFLLYVLTSIAAYCWDHMCDGLCYSLVGYFFCCQVAVCVPRTSVHGHGYWCSWIKVWRGRIKGWRISLIFLILLSKN